MVKLQVWWKLKLNTKYATNLTHWKDDWGKIMAQNYFYISHDILYAKVFLYWVERKPGPFFCAIMWSCYWAYYHHPVLPWITAADDDERGRGDEGKQMDMKVNEGEYKPNAVYRSSSNLCFTKVYVLYFYWRKTQLNGIKLVQFASHQSWFLCS